MIAASTPVWSLIGGIVGAASTVVGFGIALLKFDSLWAALKAQREKHNQPKETP